MKRLPAVAGQFYSEDADILRKEVQDFLLSSADESKAVGILVPHAGYLYSGAIAGETFGSIEVPGRVVLLGPNHTGVGHPAAVYPSGSWLTPLGETAVDSALAGRILERCPGLAADEAAHRFEHSLEVQLPFIQVRSPEASIVPICLSHAPLEELLLIGERLGEVLAESEKDVLIVASSDMTHFEPGEVAREKDHSALEEVLALDPEGLYRRVRGRGISMCGVIPTVVMLAAARRLGACRASLVRYGNSGEVTGDQSSVVGYAGVVVEGGGPK